jgi:hypothetical protein
VNRELIYWIIVFITFLYIILKNRNSSLKILIILCFYSGLASYPGDLIENPYKIVLVVLSIFLLYKYNGLSRLKLRDYFLTAAFILFSASFFLSAIINRDYFNLVFSQYGKYVTPICLYFVLNKILSHNPGAFFDLTKLFFSLLTIQIILSVVKILIIGLIETTVGSMAYIGGGPAAMVPVLGFILVWLDKNGKLERKDWYYIFLLIFIAFASIKRAIWFIMPTFILLFMYYVPRRIKASQMLYILPLIPFIFYAGVRLNPTLNKEGILGGSFDLQYVLDYTQKYNFGKTSEKSGIQAGAGRGGATYMLFGKLFSSEPLKFEDLWGFGLKEVYTTDYQEFDDLKFGVNSKGAVTGVFQSYISSGFVGIVVTILFIFSVCSLIKEPRIRNTIVLLMVWDYFFYSSLILRTQALFLLLFFIILYSNYMFSLRISGMHPLINRNVPMGLSPSPGLGSYSL